MQNRRETFPHSDEKRASREWRGVCCLDRLSDVQNTRPNKHTGAFVTFATAARKLVHDTYNNIQSTYSYPAGARGFPFFSPIAVHTHVSAERVCDQCFPSPRWIASRGKGVPIYPSFLSINYNSNFSVFLKSCGALKTPSKSFSSNSKYLTHGFVFPPQPCLRLHQHFHFPLVFHQSSCAIFLVSSSLPLPFVLCSTLFPLSACVTVTVPLSRLINSTSFAPGRVQRSVNLLLST